MKRALARPCGIAGLKNKRRGAMRRPPPPHQVGKRMVHPQMEPTRRGKRQSCAKPNRHASKPINDLPPSRPSSPMNWALNNFTSGGLSPPCFLTGVAWIIALSWHGLVGLWVARGKTMRTCFKRHGFRLRQSLRVSKGISKGISQGGRKKKHGSPKELPC